MRFEIQTLGAFVQALPPQDFMVKGLDQQGPYYQTIEDALPLKTLGEIWEQSLIKVVWNDSSTIATVTMARDTRPDKSCRVFLHKSEIFGK